MLIELVIFDCDGVLVDSETLSNRVMVELVAELGLHLQLDEAIALFKGRKMAECIAVVEERLGRAVPVDFVRQFRARSARAFESDLRPVPGITAALDKISLPVCVASNGPREKMDVALRVTGLWPYFDGRIFSSYDIESWKPEPGLFLYAATNMGAEPEACAVVEDSVLGVHAGVAAGMKVFGYAGAGEAEALAEAGAQVFYDMSQLPSLLLDSNQAQ